MNIYDISQKSGVSIATVSRVMNHSKNVSEKTRQKVLAVMEEAGYQPNAFARGLTLNTMHTIGLLCADTSDPYLGAAVSYLEQGLRQKSYDSLLGCTGYGWEEKVKCTKLLLSRHVDALIYIGSNFVDPEGEKNDYLLQAAGRIPVIMVNGYLKGKNAYSVLCDDVQASRAAARRLLLAGYRRPVFLFRAATYSALRKQQGFSLALSDAQLPQGKEQILSCTGTLAENTALLSRHFAEYPFDAVLAADDELAVAALKFARDAGLSVPEDLAVIGYNNSILSMCCQPELTSIDNRLEFLCGTAVSILMSLMEGKSAPEKTELSAEIVLRATTPNHY